MKFDAGFVKIPRRWWTLLESAPPAWVKVWIYIALNANIRPGTFMGRKLAPGQLARSIATISRDCRISPRQTRGALDGIRMTNEATIETTNQYSIITLLNWGSYSGNPDDEGQTKRQTPRHGSGQTDDKREGNNRRSKKSSSSTRSKKKELQHSENLKVPRASEQRNPNSFSPLGDDDEAAIAANPRKALRELFARTVGRQMDPKLQKAIHGLLAAKGFSIPAYIAEFKLRAPLLANPAGSGFFMQLARDIGETAEGESAKVEQREEFVMAQVMLKQPPKVAREITPGCGCEAGFIENESGKLVHCKCAKGLEMARRDEQSRAPKGPTRVGELIAI